MNETDSNNSNLQSDKENEIILYQTDSTLSLDVRVENETVWLNRNQIALLFDRDVKTIGKHINNALKEELDGISTIANFATNYICIRMENAFIYDYVVLPPKQQIPIHTQNGWELSYIICGEGLMFIGNEKQRFCKGEVVLIPPGITHGFFFDSDSADESGCIHNITLMFASDLLTRLAHILPELVQTDKFLNNRRVPRRYVGNTAIGIARLLEKMRTLNPTERLPLILQLLILITENVESEEIEASLSNRSIRNAEKFRIYCKCNFCRQITLEDAAAYMNMNKSALCKFVKRHTGQTFTEYINSLRLENASRLLISTNDSACDIAYDCGFTSIPYFHRLFSRKYGISPGVYRKKHG